jgi:hypothetical protein
MTTMIAMTGAGEGVSANDGLRFDFGNVRVAGERQKLQWLPVPVSDLIWAGDGGRDPERFPTAWPPGRRLPPGSGRASAEGEAGLLPMLR